MGRSISVEVRNSCSIHQIPETVHNLHSVYYHLTLHRSDAMKYKEIPNTNINAVSFPGRHAYGYSLFSFLVQRKSHHSASLKPAFSVLLCIFLVPGSMHVSLLHLESCAEQVPTLNPQQAKSYSTVAITESQFKPRGSVFESHAIRPFFETKEF